MYNIKYIVIIEIHIENRKKWPMEKVKTSH